MEAHFQNPKRLGEDFCFRPRRTYNYSVICEEDAWFDCVSLLESDSDDDSIGVHVRDPCPPLSRSVDTRMLQYGNASRVIDAMCNSEECLTLAVEQYFKGDGGKTEKQLRNDEMKESDRHKTISPQDDISKLVAPSCNALPPKRKSGVIKLSFKRRSHDGDETTEY